MPIRPENRFFYPIDWKELSHVIRFGRAKGCCEQCGRPHGQLITHLGDGRWWDAAAGVWRNGRGRRLKLTPLECLPAGTAVQLTRVYLACAPSRPRSRQQRTGEPQGALPALPHPARSRGAPAPALVHLPAAQGCG